MKIAVIGANGRSGAAFVKVAIAAGHELNAGYFSSPHFPDNPNIHPVKCDATDAHDLQKLINGCDAVVSLIGHVKGSPADVQTKAMTALLKVMQPSKTKRLVSLTGTGVRFKDDQITLIDRFLNLGVKIIDPNRIKDGLAAAELLKNSDADWTLIRVLKLQDIKPKKFRLRANGPTKIYVSREEVAFAILDVLQNNKFIKQAPIIGPA